MSHVPRLRLSLLASIGVGALLAGGVAAWSQTQRTTLAAGLRASLDDNSDAVNEPPLRGTTSSGRAQPRKPKTYGNPPGSGAAGTGFISTNPKPRKPGNSRLGPPLALNGGPLPITPTTEAASALTASPATLAAPGDLRRPAKRGAELPVTVEPDLRGPNRRYGGREDDAFEPTGIRVGSFILRPAIEVLGGHDSNPGRTTPPIPAKGSAVAIIAPELQVRSDWSRHELRADLRGSYTDYDSAPSLNRPYMDAKVAGRIDWTRDTRIESEGRMLISTDSPNSPDLPAGLSRLPIVTTLGATTGIAHRFNRFEIALRGSVDRITYEDSHLTDGSTASNKDRDYTQFAGIARGSYELSPGMKPFVETIIDTREHDLKFDNFGVQRDSDGVQARAGTTFEFSRKLVGEISAGYLVRTYKDPTLPDLRGVIFDGSLIWSATALTSVKLTARTGADESTLPGVSGVLRRDAVLQVDHAFRRWLIGTAKVGYGLDDYQGSTREDQRYFASLGLTYKLTRSVQVKGELRQEWLRSNIPGNDYTATIALVGMRFQR
jgi:hypothetical protein